MMYPSASTTNPEPMARCLPITELVLPFSPSSSGPYPVTNICTTLGETFLISAAADSFSLRSSSVAALLDCPRSGGDERKRPSVLSKRIAR